MQAYRKLTELVSFYDFLPTVCEATGVTPPAGRHLCGRSYLNIATNRPFPKKRPWRDLVFGEFRYAEMARDNRFKLVTRRGGEGPNELYDIREDPRERRNLYELPSHVTVRERLQKDLAAWKQRLG